ncbi:flagellar hook-associated protein FlgK [Sphingomonas aracearum]|uniref:Flagellar hook-associated protein 1 n=1 Tax=Sphingomonas aracearum TaxID=2283317 RepID=A0A369VW58_9SPHN|nr:flagellar hook-associated protein FlgK [Sphingomonas aracearum]RDE05875.1 flagellar hook-associated protein FlgK [Sphingomonas aracearum]
MSDLLSIGASGVRAYQTALSTVSDNIANVGTEGYVRRTATTREVSATGIGLAAKPVTPGNGVVVSGIARAADMFRAADVRAASTDLSRTATSVTWMGRIDGALTGNQLGTRITSFFNAATAVAADPTASAPRSAMLEAGTTVANAFSATGKALDQLTVELDATAEDATAQVDALSQKLARINDGLARAASGSSAAASLLDQRDKALEDMSALVDVSASFDALGRSTVKIGGANGAVMVAGLEAGHLTYVREADGTTSFAVHKAGEVTSIKPAGGVLAGVGEAATRLHDARRDLNGVADGFMTGVNAVQTQGADVSGAAGQPFFELVPGGTATDFRLKLTDPNGIAAAGMGKGPRDNSNLLDMDTGLAGVRASGAFETRVTDLVAANAAALAGRQSVAEAQSAIRDAAVAARDGQSGVNLDNEAVDLMRFQQAYSASSRVIQVARETFQTIIGIN